MSQNKPLLLDQPFENWHFEGLPSYRLEQIREWIFEKGTLNFEKMSNKMKNKIIKLTEIDIENIVKKVISEQAESNKCTGTNEIKPPFIKTEIIYKDENGKFGTGGDVPAVVKFHLRAYFPTAGSSDEVYQDALLQLKQQVEDELSSKQLNAKYDLVLVKVDNVIGSASNYLNGPLQPTHYRGKPIESSKLSSEPYVNLPKEGVKTPIWKRSFCQIRSQFKLENYTYSLQLVCVGITTLHSNP